MGLNTSDQCKNLATEFTLRPPMPSSRKKLQKGAKFEIDIFQKMVVSLVCAEANQVQPTGFPGQECGRKTLEHF